MANGIETIFHELDIASRVVLAVFCMLFGLMFFKRRRELELKSSRMVFLGQSLFLIAFGVTRILFLIQGWFKPLAENPYTIFDDPAMSDLMWRVATFVGILAIIFLLLVIETYLVKSRYVFTLTATVGLILTLVFDVNTARIVT